MAPTNASQAEPSKVLRVGLAVEHEQAAARRRKREREIDHECQSELAFMEHWRKSHKPLRPVEPGHARDKMAALTERVLSRVRGGTHSSSS